MLKKQIYCLLLTGALFAVGLGACQTHSFGETLKTSFQDFILQALAATVT